MRNATRKNLILLFTIIQVNIVWAMACYIYMYESFLTI